MKTYKCKICQKFKAQKEFYEGNTGICILCNPDRLAISRYKAQARIDPEQFAGKIIRQERLLNMMREALEGVRL